MFVSFAFDLPNLQLIMIVAFWMALEQTIKNVNNFGFYARRKTKYTLGKNRFYRCFQVCLFLARRGECMFVLSSFLSTKFECNIHVCTLQNVNSSAYFSVFCYSMPILVISSCFSSIKNSFLSALFPQ